MRLLKALAALTLALVLAVVVPRGMHATQVAGVPGVPATADATVAATATATAVVGAAVDLGSASPDTGKPCEEDEPCFNPCTMGVNGLYPVSDPRYLVPGPCGLDSELPHGRRFALEVSAAPTVADPACTPEARGRIPITVAIHVTEADGTAMMGGTTAVAEVCARLVNGVPDLSGTTPRLFYLAARTA